MTVMENDEPTAGVDTSGHPVTLSPGHPVTLSPLRAWLALVRVSFQRQARARQMVWIALGLLAFAVLLTAVNTAAGRWTMREWRSQRITFQEYREKLTLLRASVPWPAGGAALQDALLEGAGALIDGSGFFIFSNVLFSVFLSFLLPIWSLSFSVDALGGEREGGNIVWLLTRPISRPAIYLAKFVALLPWSVGLNMGGFALICLAAGKPGALGFRLYWPAVLWASLAFSALFFLVGAVFRRPAVVGIVYCFFLESFLGNMPGYMKRVSIGFYTRCMMFEAGKDYDVQPEKPTIYLPVDGSTAQWVLIGASVILLLIGMFWFSRTEYVTVE